MTEPTDPVEAFAALVDRPPEQVDLARAALAFAAAASAPLDADAWLAELDHLAAGVRDFDGLRERLFIEEGFVGARDDYYDPDNSLLDRVLARRRGIPISLSVVAIETGKRAGVAVEGVNAPGHFLIRDPVTGALCDAFNAGAWVDEPESAGPLPLADAHQILARMLNNLVSIYQGRGRLNDLEWTLRCQRAIPLARAEATLRLGRLLSQRGQFLDASAVLLATAEEVDATDAERLTNEARSLRARLN